MSDRSKIGSWVTIALVAGAGIWLSMRDGRNIAAASTAPAGVVDSTVPREIALAEFQRGLLETDSLAGGAASREELVRQVVDALERRDTAALARRVLSKSEFAFIFYPTNPQGLPPYDLSPSLLWFLIEGRSRKGLAHLLTERSGVALGYLGTRCLGQPNVEGENRVYGPCVVSRVQAVGDTLVEQLFGPMIERRGRWKLVSYANRLD